MKDYQLIQPQDSSATGSHSPGSQVQGVGQGQGPPQAQLTRYLSNFTSIISHLLQSSQDSSTPDAVEASWVVSLALKGLYNTLKVPQKQSHLLVIITQLLQYVPFSLFNMTFYVNHLCCVFLLDFSYFY